MGTWSHEPFGNDTANDWAYGLEETKDLSLIESTLDTVIEQADGYLEASDAEEAIAAVEVLAKMLGRGTQSDAYTKKVEVWVASIAEKPSAELLQKAQQALERIVVEDSELSELWQEADESHLWNETMAQLKAAIST